MHYEIFIPEWSPRGDAGEKLETVARRGGFADLLGGHDVLRCDEGPDDKSGALIGWLSPENTQLVFRPDRQVWLPSFAKSEGGQSFYYVGIWKDHPPTESELRRHYTQDGERVKLGESKWILPTPTTVDARAVYADDGQSMRWEPVRQFSWMCDEAEAMRERYLGPAFGLRNLEFECNPIEQVNWLLRLLRVNYRLTPEVADFLGMWTRKHIVIDAVLATLGLKRKEPGEDG